jgi:hypothetical protein
MIVSPLCSDLMRWRCFGYTQEVELDPRQDVATYGFKVETFKESRPPFYLCGAIRLGLRTNIVTRSEPRPRMIPQPLGHLLSSYA